MLLGLCFLAVGFLIAFLTTPWVIRLAATGIGLDAPNETRKRQSVPIPRLGGMPIMLAISLGLGVIFWIQPGNSIEWFPLLVGGLLMYGLGLWDDLKPLGARKKLAGQIAVASLVYFMGLTVDRVSYPGGGWSVELGMSSYFATVFWLIAVPNIINLIDGFDGLASGLGLFMAVTLGIVGLHNEQVAVAWYAFTLAGALLGFLIFNFPPARIYLGDGGAYLIGFTIAALSLKSSNKGSVAAVLLVTIIALGIPILDTVFALARRAMRGYPIFHADDEHFHHRLEGFGFTKRRILLGMYAVAVVLSLIALSVIWSQGRTLPIAAGAIFVLVIFILRRFHSVRSLGDFRRKTDRLLGRRRHVQYALLQARLLDMEIDRCESAQEFWAVFEHTVRRVGFTKPGEAVDETEINVTYNGSIPWTLHAPKSNGTHSEWQRIAECFRPVYARARLKWEVD